MKEIKVGTQVRAIVPVIEGDIAPDVNAAVLAAGWVHANLGDEGIVGYIEKLDEEDGVEVLGFTVRFDKSGTASMIFRHEFEVV